ncbi:hypothetical protein BGZ46_001684 [Entomortierella lignicola]|nr:hypothetical protein BGZ46_001684 [Entomortierella lignicola]
MQEAEELEALILAKEQEKEEEELEIKEKEEEKEEELEIKEKEDKANATSKGDSKDIKESTDVDELTERLEATGLSSKDNTQLDAKANSKERDAAVHKSDAKDASKAVPSAKEEKNKTSADTK